MGCAGSNVKDQVVLDRPMKGPRLMRSPGFSTMSQSEINQTQLVFQTIINNIKEIEFPISQNLSIALDNTSVPIFFASIGEIIFPLFSIYAKKSSRIAIFSDIRYVETSLIQKKDNLKLFSNLFRAFHRKTEVNKTLVFSSITDTIAASFGGFNLQIEEGNFDAILTNYNTIIITTDIDISGEFTDRLQDYVENGGSVILFYNGNLKKTNKFLERYQLAFTECEYFAKNQNLVVRTAKNYQEVSSCNLNSIFFKAKHALSKEDVNVNVMDEIFTQIRIHIQNLENYRILQQPYNYLSDYINAKRQNATALCMILLLEMSKHIPQEFQKDLVPAVDCPLKDVELTITTVANEWTPLNLYLPPKTQTNFEISDDSVILQVGSHTDDLLKYTGNYSRFPQVVKIFSQGTVYSEFGGLLYLISDKNIEVQVKLSNVAEDEYSPWKYLDFGCYSFVVDKNLELERDFTDISDAFQSLDTVITSVIPIKSSFKPLIVFDITDGNVQDDLYPITINTDNMHNVMNPTKASDDLEMFIARIIRLRFAEYDIDPSIESQLSTIGAICVMKKAYPSFAQDRYLEGLCLKINYFVERFGIGSFGLAVQGYLTNKDKYEDSKIVLVQELCLACGHNISPLFSEYVSMPEDVLESLSSLPQ